MSIAIKICGLSDEITVQAAAQLGADFIGFVHYPKSPRHVTIEKAEHLKSRLPKSIKSVVVLVNPDDDLLAEIAREIQPDFFQLHGDENTDRLVEIRKKFPKIGLIKAIPVSHYDDIKKAEIFYKTANFILFDAKPTDKNMMHGGNGISFDWDLLKQNIPPIPWFLSGGLNPNNVREAIQKTEAKMIDVSSGVESSAGVKDIKLIEQFVKAARE